MRGSVQKRKNKSGIVWVVRIELPPDPVTGKRRQRGETYPDKEAADVRLSEWLVDLRRNGVADAQGHTVASFLRYWHATYVVPELRVSTQESYRYYIERKIAPIIGTVPLAKLSAAHIRDWIAKLRTMPAGPGNGRPKPAPGDSTVHYTSAKTIRTMQGVLRHALTDAVTWGYITRNPTDTVPSVRVPRPQMKIWSAAQLRHFLAIAAANPGKHAVWGPIWLVAVSTGLRMGELVALRWSDIDLDRGRLHVSRTLARITPATRQSPQFNEPKSRAGRRAIPLPPQVIAALKLHQSQQQVARLQRGGDDPDSDLVFATADGGLILPANVSRAFHHIIATSASQLPRIRFHDLRHSHATLLLQSNVSPKIVSERLGHATVAMTLDVYAHVLPDMQESAALAVSAALFDDSRAQTVHNATGS